MNDLSGDNLTFPVFADWRLNLTEAQIEHLITVFWPSPNRNRSCAVDTVKSLESKGFNRLACKKGGSLSTLESPPAPAFGVHERPTVLRPAGGAIIGGATNTGVVYARYQCGVQKR